MLSYLFKRLLVSIPTLIAISLVVFFILALAPGDPMGELATNPAVTAEVRENLRRSLGLDQPIYIRYFKWAIAFLRGDMGYSFVSRRPVVELLIQRLPATFWVIGSAYLLAVLLALPLGLISAFKRYSLLDRFSTAFAFFWFSLPTFFTGLLFIIVFSVQLRWLPFVYNSTLQVTDWSTFLEQVKQSIMPVFVLGLYQSALLMRFVRSSILEQVNQLYVRTAYAKGLSEFTVAMRHIFRNAMIPIVTLVALNIPGIFTGSLVTEQIFRVPGIGALLIESIYRSDTPVVMAVTLIYAILIVLFNLVADLIYGILDPRVNLK